MYIFFGTIAFTFALWLGLYLLKRDPGKPELRYTSLGLSTYALVLAINIITPYAPNSFVLQIVNRLHWAILLFPSLFWSGANIALSAEYEKQNRKIALWWKWIVVPIGVILCILITSTNVLWDATDQTLSLAGYICFGIVNLLPLFAIFPVIKNIQKNQYPKKSLGGLLIATLFFTLGVGLLILQSSWIPHWWIILAIGVDLEILGIAIATFDTFEQGEALIPDLLYSLAFSIVTVLLLGGQIAIAMTISTGVTFPMLMLLFATIAIALITQMFADWIQVGLDRIIFAHFPAIRQDRTTLRGVASALPRKSQTFVIADIDEKEFIRFTRKALSHFGNLPRLSSSPLTNLPIIVQRLQERGASTNTLERTIELKKLLEESINRLKPNSSGNIGMSDEWRYYNALYFPYVVGLRPYSRREKYQDVDQDTQQILNWFRSQVPERTLYNWQNAAARLIAQDLKEQGLQGHKTRR